MSPAEWSTAQIFVALATLLFLIFLSFVYLKSAAGFTARRWTTLFCILAISIIVGFAIGGGTLSVPRTITLVASCSTGQNDILDASTFFSNQYPPGKLILFDSGQSGPSASCPKLADKLESISPAINQAVHISFDTSGAHPIEILLNIAGELSKPSLRAGLQLITDLFSRETLVFLFEKNNPDWEQGLQLENLSLSRVLESHIQSPFEWFVYPLSRQRPQLQLRAHVFGSVESSIPLEFSNLMVKLSITGPRTIEQDLLEIELCISLDEPADVDTCRQRAISSPASSVNSEIYFEKLTLHRFNKGLWRWTMEPGSSKPQLFTDLMEGAVDAGKPSRNFRRALLEPAWHSLSFKARILNGANHNLKLNSENVFFKVSNTKPTIIFDSTNLTTAAWPLPIGSTSGSMDIAETLFESVWPQPHKLSRKRFSGLSSPWPDCVLSANTDISRIQDCASQSATLILVEPTEQLLEKLTSASIPETVTSLGSTILVIGPPSLSGSHAPAIKDWLPAWSRAVAGGNEVSTTNLLRQVLFLGDCGLLAHQPFESEVDSQLDPAATRPVDLQAKIVEAFIEKLNSIPELSAVEFSPTLGSSDSVVRYENKNDWSPAIQLNSRIGCIHPMLEDTPDRNALIEASRPELVLHTFTIDQKFPVPPPYMDLLDATSHPRSTVVLFSTRIISPTSRISSPITTDRVKGAGRDFSDVKVEYSTTIFNDLAKKGIDVVVVELPSNDSYRSIANGANWGTELSTWKAHPNVRVIPYTGGTDAGHYVDTIYKLLLDRWASTASRLQTNDFSRVIDPRLIDASSLVPSAFINMERADDSVLIASLAPNEIPLIVEKTMGVGRVVSIAFSPFDPLLWTNDLLDPSALFDTFKSLYPPTHQGNEWGAEVAQLDRVREFAPAGMGPLRLVDAIDVSSSTPMASNRLILDSIEISKGVDQADFGFRVPSGLSAWKTPTITLPNTEIHCSIVIDGDQCPLVLMRVDSLTSRVFYRFSTSAPGGLAHRPSGYKIHNGSARDLDSSFVHFWVTAREPLGKLSLDKLAGVSNLFEGRMITGLIPKASANVFALASISILLFTILLFSPLIRPWTSLERWFRKFSTVDESPTLGFDPENVKRRLAEHLAHYEAGRRAGDPAWTRRFQAGDSLSRANLLDLAAFTSISKRLKLEKVPPKVRLKETGIGFDLIICLDDSRSLLHPSDSFGNSRKAHTAISLIDIFARSADLLGGRWSLFSLRSGESLRPTKGQALEMVTENVEKWLKQGIPSKEVHQLPASAKHSVLVLISDFRASTAKQVLDTFDNQRATVIMLWDPEQASEVGITYDVTTGALYDRNEWSKSDVLQLSKKHQAVCKIDVEQLGNGFALIDVQASDLEVAESLIDSGLFSSMWKS